MASDAGLTEAEIKILNVKSALSKDYVKNSDEISKTFIVFRNLFDLTQSDFAQLLGINRRQLLGDIESGRVKIPYNVLYRFNEIVGDIQKCKDINLNYFQSQTISLIKMEISTYLDAQ